MAINRKPQYAVIDEHHLGISNFKGWRAYYRAEPTKPYNRILLLAKGYPNKGNFTDEQSRDFVIEYNDTGKFVQNIHMPKYLPKVLSRKTMYSRVQRGYHFTADYITEEKFNKIFEKMMIHLI